MSQITTPMVYYRTSLGKGSWIDYDDTIYIDKASSITQVQYKCVECNKTHRISVGWRISTVVCTCTKITSLQWSDQSTTPPFPCQYCHRGEIPTETAKSITLWHKEQAYVHCICNIIILEKKERVRIRGLHQ